MKRLIMMVGLPRSGKSTVAQETQERGANNSMVIPIVCTDDVRVAIHGKRFDREFEGLVWYITGVMVKALFRLHDEVILDATNTTEAARAKFKSKNWCRHYDVVATPVEVCLQRARDTNQEDLLPVIERMSEQFEPVTPEERLDASRNAEREEQA